jgi:hypothetical protein
MVSLDALHSFERPLATDDIECQHQTEYYIDNNEDPDSLCAEQQKRKQTVKKPSEQYGNAQHQRDHSVFLSMKEGGN